MRAQKDSGCKFPDCGVRITKGIAIVLDKTYGYVHEFHRNDKRYTQAPAQAEQLQKTPEQIEAEVIARVMKAREIVAKIFSMPLEDVRSDTPLMTEVCRELYGQKWLEKEAKA